MVNDSRPADYTDLGDVSITDVRYLTGDTHMRTLTISRAGGLYPNGHRIFVDHLVEADLDQIINAPVPAGALPF